MSDSVRPHRRQPTRLPRSWDSPGNNTGVGCHFLLQCMKSEKWKWSRSVVTDSLGPHGLQPTRLLCAWDFPGKSAGMGCHFLLQAIFLTQESNPGLLHCRQMLYHLSHQGSQHQTINLLLFQNEALLSQKVTFDFPTHSLRVLVVKHLSVHPDLQSIDLIFPYFPFPL